MDRSKAKLGYLILAVLAVFTQASHAFGQAAPVLPPIVDGAAIQDQANAVGSGIEAATEGVVEQPPIGDLTQPVFLQPATSPVAPRRPLQASFLGLSLLGSSASPEIASVPDMFGDFHGGGGGLNNGQFQNGLPPRGGVGTRSIKLAENLSPQPRNRSFVTYHFFNDVLDGKFGDVNRYTIGFERSNAAGTRSIDVRLPIANTLASQQVNERPIQKGNEIGNATIILKQVLASTPNSLFSGGVGIAVPTADDGVLFRPGDNQEILRVKNESVHLLPYVGYIKNLGPRWFSQGFLQLDLDLSGNEVFGDPNAMNLLPLGVVQDPTLLFVDVGLGYRVFENRVNHVIHNMSIAAEFHYATTIQDTDRLPPGPFFVGDSTRRFDVLNFTLGANMGVGHASSLRPGIVVPVRGGDDQQFDYEVFLQFNRYF